jgi:hypothetical protein
MRVNAFRPAILSIRKDGEDIEPIKNSNLFTSPVLAHHNSRESVLFPTANTEILLLNSSPRRENLEPLFIDSPDPRPDGEIKDKDITFSSLDEEITEGNLITPPVIPFVISNENLLETE